MEYSPTEFGIVGIVLLFAWKVIELLAMVAKTKLNGHIADPTPCIEAVERLATVVSAYVGEDRDAHRDLLKGMAHQGRQIDELHKAHLGPAAMDPKTGSPRWWSIHRD